MPFRLFPLRRAVHVWKALLSAHRTSFHLFLSKTLCTQPRVWSHGAVVGEAPLALLARLAALAAGVESSFELSPAMLEMRSWFVLLAGGASVWPRFRRALMAHPAALRVLSQLPDFERLVA